MEKDKKTYSDAEKLQILVKGLCGYMADHIEQNVPEKGIFSGNGFNFDVCGTENRGMLRVDYRDSETRSLRLGVLRSGTDRLYSHFLPSGTKAELIRYLRDPATPADLLEQIRHLSDSVDNYWD